MAYIFSDKEELSQALTFTLMIRRPKVATPLGKNLRGNFGLKNGKKDPRLIAGVVLLICIPIFGTTLAASVTISGKNGSTAIEFGQGSQVAVACDTSITNAIGEEWASSSNYFGVNKIQLTGLNASPAPSAVTSDQGCGGKELVVQLLDSNGAPIALGTNGGTAIHFIVPSVSATPGAPISIVSPSPSGVLASIAAGATWGASTEIDISLPTLSPVTNATSVARVALESNS